MANDSVRNRYVSDGAGVVPPPRLLVMLFDRLVLDLEQSEEALVARNVAVANDKLIHAQAIILELHAALDPQAWDGAEGLGQLYMWFNNELMQANIEKNPKPVRNCLPMIRDLRDAWHLAYNGLHGTAGAPQVATAAPA